MRRPSRARSTRICGGGPLSASSHSSGWAMRSPSRSRRLIWESRTGGRAPRGCTGRSLPSPPISPSSASSFSRRFSQILPPWSSPKALAISRRPTSRPAARSSSMKSRMAARLGSGTDKAATHRIKAGKAGHRACLPRLGASRQHAPSHRTENRKLLSGRIRCGQVEITVVEFSQTSGDPSQNKKGHPCGQPFHCRTATRRTGSKVRKLTRNTNPSKKRSRSTRFAPAADDNETLDHLLSVVTDKKEAKAILGDS
ncbi:hypothetical protein BOSEA31B_10234 [Hyphomicrobiales bacterium]|nr:hypothetical protein BOSEA31B_10234 [Hyphomicrobiales bacterium]CAH1701913.1 hypothetical protein BOSEA1005_21612 [Hyphomicrobiales bacterium]CAI0346070.1 hypothetical protein BO1005MUT1_470228 [Hyphomicrobiales bacterium]